MVLNGAVSCGDSHGQCVVASRETRCAIDVHACETIPWNSHNRNTSGVSWEVHDRVVFNLVAVDSELRESGLRRDHGWSNLDVDDVVGDRTVFCGHRNGDRVRSCCETRCTIDHNGRVNISSGSDDADTWGACINEEPLAVFSWVAVHSELCEVAVGRLYVDRHGVGSNGAIFCGHGDGDRRGARDGKTGVAIDACNCVEVSWNRVNSCRVAAAR